MKNYTLIPALLTALALVVGITPTAQADTPPVQASVTAEAIVNASAKEVRGIDFQLSDAPPVFSEIHVSAFSCGNFLQESTRTTAPTDGEYAGTAWVWFSPDGMPGRPGNSVAQKVGKSVEYQIDIIEPGYDAYHLSGSVTEYGIVDGRDISDSRPTCDKLNNTTTCQVLRQAQKVGKARVRYRVRVVAPQTNGECGRTRIAWKLNGKVVNHGNKLWLTRAMRHKRLVATVKLSHGPKKVLRFGRIR